jgi:pimeloyl-ACP methyl ester carboxylesterase
MAARRMIAIAAGAVVGFGLLLAAYTEVRTRRLTAAYPPIGRLIDVGGVRLHVLDLLPSTPESADAPAIVFLHGASANLRDPVLAFRAALEGRHRLVFIDRPGHGHSERGPDPDIAAPDRQAALVAALLDRIGIGRAILVGHSWGGSVVAAFGVGFPERTAGLVFLAPATHPWPGGVAWYYKVAAAPVIGPLFARTLSLPVGELALEGGLKGVFSPNQEPDDYLEKTATPLLFRPPEFVANAQDVAGMNAHLARMAPRYPDIRAPTVILSGNRDSVVYEELHSGGLARDIPGARLIWLDGVGHMPQHAATETAVAAIEEVANLARGRALALR